MTHAVRVQGLCFGYRGRPPILEGIDLVVERGEFLGILGPNGAGKSSLIQLLAGLHKPNVGTIAIMDRPVREMRHRIGYMPQQAPLIQHLPVTVAALVQLGCLQGWHPLGRTRSGERQRAQAVLAQMELGERSARLLRELSGGELQRALLARTLAADPAILLLDEPTAHIDPAAESRIWSLLRRMTPERTVIAISHDPALLRMHADRIALLNGRLRMVTPEGMDAAALQWAYSRHPEGSAGIPVRRGAAG